MSTDYEIRLAAKGDASTIIRHLQEHFYYDEPLNQYLNQENNVKPDNRDRGHHHLQAINEELSFVAVTPSDEIVGVAINQRFTGFDPIDENSCKDNANSWKIYKHTSAFDLEVEEILRRPPNEGKEQMMVAVISVVPEWRGKGISVKLLGKTRELAKKKGFEQMFSVCSSAFSAGLFEKMGYECFHSKKYEEIKENGEIVFRLPPPHTHMKALIFNIQA